MTPSPKQWEPDSWIPSSWLLFFFDSEKPKLSFIDFKAFIPRFFNSRIFLAFRGIANNFSFSMFIFVYLSLSLVMMKTSFCTSKDSMPFFRTSATKLFTMLYIWPSRKVISAFCIEPLLNDLSDLDDWLSLLASYSLWIFFSHSPAFDHASTLLASGMHVT